MKVGKNVNIHHTVQKFGDNIEIGDNVRIDAFCIISGNVKIGSNVHIGAYVFLSGQHGIEISDYAQIAPKTTILSGCDDFSGESLIGPTIPDEYKPFLKTGKVTFEKHAVIGASSVVFPGVTLHEGAAVGALSLVSRDIDGWAIYAGVPAKYIKDRSKTMLALQNKYEAKKGA